MTEEEIRLLQEKLGVRDDSDLIVDPEELHGDPLTDEEIQEILGKPKKES